MGVTGNSQGSTVLAPVVRMLRLCWTAPGAGAPPPSQASAWPAGTVPAPRDCGRTNRVTLHLSDGALRPEPGPLLCPPINLGGPAISLLSGNGLEMHTELQAASSGVSVPVLGSCRTGHTRVCGLPQCRDVGTLVWHPRGQCLHSGCHSGPAPGRGLPPAPGRGLPPP